MSDSTLPSVNKSTNCNAALELTGSRIKLLPFDVSDKELFMTLSMCPAMMQHIANPFTLDEATTNFDNRTKLWGANIGEQLTLSINEKSSGEKLGSIALKIIAVGIAEVGIMIKPAAQCKGFASEALGVITHYVFNILEFSKLVAVCSADNISSCKALEKAGFVREKCLRGNSFINAKYIDDYVYGLCRYSV